jgi:tripartite-type tricarboxylate transporter receptor subunit TctC
MADTAINRRKLVGLAAAALAPLATGDRALAQASFPNRVVRLICPIAAGGGIDAVTRLLASRLAEIWQQQVVVENRTGGSNNIAAEAVARSEPDGYTIFATPSSLSVAGLLFASLGYDPVGDFAPVSLIGTYPNVMVVPNSSPARSVEGFIAYANANRGKITFASGGHGSSLHLAGALFKRMTGIEMTHVPYRGAAPAFNDLIPGRVDVMFNLISSSLPLARSGKIRILAVATLQRAAIAPDLPTVAESGVPGFDVSSWIGLFVPAKTSPAIEEMGVEVVGSSPAELAAQVKADITKWGPVIREAGISVRE